MFIFPRTRCDVFVFVDVFHDINVGKTVLRILPLTPQLLLVL